MRLLELYYQISLSCATMFTWFCCDHRFVWRLTPTYPDQPSSVGDLLATMPKCLVLQSQVSSVCLRLGMAEHYALLPCPLIIVV